MKLIGSEPKEKNEITLTIDVTPEEFNEAINKAYLKNKNRIGVPGFRKGKAPRKIIEKMYGIAIFVNDALDILLPDVLKFVFEDTEFDVVGYPRVTNIELKDNDTHAELTLSCALRPSVKLGKYKGLKAPKRELEIGDDEIMREVERVRGNNARLETVEREAQLGDVSIIDFEGFIEGEPFEGGKGENYELELGSGRFIPGFEDKIVGMKVGDERDIDLVFPEQYKKELAGKPVVFKVKLQDLKEKQLPELDDEFAQDVSEFDTLDEYKNDIREKIARSRQAQIDEEFEGLLMEQIVDSMEVDIPDAMLDEQVDKSMENLSRQISAYGMQPAQYMKMMGIDQAEFEERMQENAEGQVKVKLALREIAKLEGVEISPDEIEEEYKKAAEEHKTPIEKVKERVKPEILEEDLLMRAAAKIVIDSAVPEKAVKSEKAEKAEKPEPDKE